MYQVNQEILYQEELEKERALNNTLKKSPLVSGIKKDFKKKKRSEVRILTMVILVLAIVADLFGLIPIAGAFFSICFGVVLTILYCFDSMGRGGINKRIKKLTRKVILKIILFVIEFFFSPFPGFTIEALVNIYLLEKGYYKKIEIINNKAGKIKKIINRFK